MALDPILTILQKIEESLKNNLIGVEEYIDKFSKKHSSEMIDEVEVSDYDAASLSIEEDFKAGAIQLALFFKVKIELGFSLEDILNDCKMLIETK